MFFYNLSETVRCPARRRNPLYQPRREHALVAVPQYHHGAAKGAAGLFTAESVQALREMMREGVEQEIAWGHYVIGDDIPGTEPTR